ncbi:glycogenin glucosyltransferase [Lithohypha guttulata]|uniref:glycogenin glucosyltransferase n=1 Tax=Lithohypha guttulata TaxID=1690604 RepID=A0AAN7SX51_9EURO|nr:glycogenin glucosyltransferase [Lithohypha guttulata]
MAFQHDALDAVYATLVMTDSYLPGAMVLGHSLRDRGAKAKLVACVVLDKLSQTTIKELQVVYDDIVPVEQIFNQQPANLYLMNRPDLISTFTKIELWKLKQYKRIVYLDADMVALRAPNELLSMDTNFAAVPDVGWPDCFNSGLMVFNPNMSDYYSLLALARRGISFDGADQGLLNMHFVDWERLSFVYNCTPNANYQYVPAYRYFQSSINIIHFIGADKPWTRGRDHTGDHGVYSELLARWWSVYDRHYRRPAPVDYNQFVQPQKKVQDYVRGEETPHQPAYQLTGHASEPRSSHGYQITQPHPQSVPGIHITAPEHNQAAMERPFGDQPALEERIDRQETKPMSTQEQRRWSAPHTDWQPAIQPPPTGSKPEAANFPSQQYEMSDSKQLFEPPTQYPEPPRDMWYDIPQQKPTPSVPPKAIFPWEEKGLPKATRVFPKSRESTPPPPEPELAPTTVDEPVPDVAPMLEPQPNERQRHATSSNSAQPHQDQRPPSPLRHIFPWESRAPKPTRYFAPDPTMASTTPSMSQIGVGTIHTPGLVGDVQSRGSRPPDNPWDAFSQQTNKWDEDPDITRFIESFNKPRKAPIQVVHDSRSKTGTDDLPPVRERRTSLRLTDFPTEVERPSLPVTPAPIRRTNYFGIAEEISKGDLPVAQGVPQQDEWVRHFTSKFLPHIPNPVLLEYDSVLHLTCQHCGQQNPIIKLEELQRRQSLLMTGDEDPIAKSQTPPKRDMPESKSAEQAIEAAMKALNASHGRAKGPTKPILRQPRFEITQADDDQLGDEGLVASAHPHMTATGHKSPTRFNPIVLEGEAASEKTSVLNSPGYMSDEADEVRTATHHHTESFDYSGSSLSPTQTRSDLPPGGEPPTAALKEALQEAARDAEEEAIISPTTVA